MTPEPIMVMRPRRQVEMTPTMNHLHLHAKWTLGLKWTTLL